MSDYVTWPELLAWAKAHGAINDRIESIQLSATLQDGEMRGVVSIVGFATNENGKPYEFKNEAARWQVTNHLLRSLPGRPLSPRTYRDPRDPE